MYSAAAMQEHRNRNRGEKKREKVLTMFPYNAVSMFRVAPKEVYAT